MNVDSIKRGLVIDHIKAGKSMDIYKFLELDKLDCSVAIIKNARSKKQGLKDMIKIEGRMDIDLDFLGFLDDNITINVIRNGNIIEKKYLTLPKKIVGLAKCKNPRCITSVEQGLKHEFILTDPENRVYRCRYCEEKYEEEKA